jgi:hypothetical protein
MWRAVSNHMPLLKEKFWTLSVWEGRTSLGSFVYSLPHNQSISDLASHTGPVQQAAIFRVEKTNYPRFAFGSKNPAIIIQMKPGNLVNGIR